LTIELRPGGRDDLASIAQIQAVSPEASQWDVPEYFKYDLLVALCDGRVAGFVVARRLAEGEGELLNLAVDPAFRRRGIGRRLVAEVTSFYPGVLWLEVRDSNVDARKFYQSLGFREAGFRAGYYADSAEGAIVMNVHS
jgi:[ribosomal protein S18]-alanine N-acetyltransferase